MTMRSILAVTLLPCPCMAPSLTSLNYTEGLGTPAKAGEEIQVSGRLCSHVASADAYQGRWRHGRRTAQQTIPE